MTLNEMLFLSILFPVCAALIALIYFTCKSRLNENMRRYLFGSVCSVAIAVPIVWALLGSKIFTHGYNEVKYDDKHVYLHEGNMWHPRVFDGNYADVASLSQAMRLKDKPDNNGNADMCLIFKKKGFDTEYAIPFGKSLTPEIAKDITTKYYAVRDSSCAEKFAQCVAQKGLQNFDTQQSALDLFNDTNRTQDLIMIAQQKLQENRVNNCLITVEKPDYYTRNVLFNQPGKQALKLVLKVQ